MRASLLVALVVPTLWGCTAGESADGAPLRQQLEPSVVDARMERMDALVQEYGNTRMEIGENGRIQWMEVDLEGGVTERYEFDEQGRPALWRVDAPGEDRDVAEHYRWNDDNRLVHLRHDEPGDEQDYFEWFSYYPDGRLAEYARGTPAEALPSTETYQYDGAGRLIYRAYDPGYPGGGPAYVERFEYDEFSRPVYRSYTEDDETKNVSEWYAWDAQNRLVHLIRDAYGDENDLDETYTYGPSGERIAER